MVDQTEGCPKREILREREREREKMREAREREKGRDGRGVSDKYMGRETTREESVASHEDTQGNDRGVSFLL